MYTCQEPKPLKYMDHSFALECNVWIDCIWNLPLSSSNCKIYAAFKWPIVLPVPESEVYFSKETIA